MPPSDKGRLVAEAIAKLNINVPIYDWQVDLETQTVTLWLYGRSEPMVYRKRTRRRRSSTRKE